jgi:hypothetical protein
VLDVSTLPTHVLLMKGVPVHERILSKELFEHLARIEGRARAGALFVMFVTELIVGLTLRRIA